MLSRVGPYLALVLGAAGALSVAGTGCDVNSAGQRCNPSLSHNPCDNGLVCTVPDFCVEAYCCPTTVTPSDNPYCQPGCAGGAAAVCNDVTLAVGPQTLSAAQGAAFCAFASCVGDGGSPQGCDMSTMAMEDGGAPAADSGTEGSTPEGAAPEGSAEAATDAPSTDASDGGSPAETGGGDASDAGPG